MFYKTMNLELQLKEMTELQYKEIQQEQTQQKH